MCAYSHVGVNLALFQRPHNVKVKSFHSGIHTVFLVEQPRPEVADGYLAKVYQRQAVEAERALRGVATRGEHVVIGAAFFVDVQIGVDIVQQHLVHYDLFLLEIRLHVDTQR